MSEKPKVLFDMSKAIPIHPETPKLDTGGHSPLSIFAPGTFLGDLLILGNVSAGQLEQRMIEDALRGSIH